MKKSYRFAKIIATLGPATYSYEKIKLLIIEGVNLFRLNFSHGLHIEHKQFIEWIRHAEKELDTTVGIIGDLQGPKFRIGPIANNKVFYKPGEIISFIPEGEKGSKEVLIFPHPEVFGDIEVKDLVLVDDGKMALEVIQLGKKEIRLKVLTEGAISSGKGVNLPKIKRKDTFLTCKDKQDLEFAMGEKVDYIAISFVQSYEDLQETKDFIKECSDDEVGIIAKVEKPAALDNLNDIIENSDAIMIARGDLGVEVSPEKVPILQKYITQECRQKGVPVIVATQMLDSMVNYSRPTRAEASDVATAVYQGADALLLSAESASGKYPVEAVGVMGRIIKEVEEDLSLPKIYEVEAPYPEKEREDAIALAAKNILKVLDVSAIISFPVKGENFHNFSRQRLLCPILEVVNSKNICRRLSLIWGVLPIYRQDMTGDLLTLACNIAKQKRLAEKKDTLLVTSSAAINETDKVNSLHITSIT